MGFHKVEDCWVFLKSKTHQEEHGASNLNNEDGDEVVPMEDDTVQATDIHATLSITPTDKSHLLIMLEVKG